MPRVTVGPFSLEAPQDWTLSTVILAGPIENQQSELPLHTPKAAKPFQRNLVATMEKVDPKETVESYVQRQTKGLLQARVEFHDFTSKTVTLSSGLAGLVTERVITNSGDRVRQMQLVSIKDGIAHTLVLSHLDGSPFEAVRDEFRTILLSWGST